MIFPYGQEKNTVRLIPWVTIMIIALNFIIHWHITSVNKKIATEIYITTRKLIRYYIRHPYLDFMKESRKNRVNYGNDFDQKARIFDKIREKYGKITPDEITLSEEQAHLDSLIRKLNDIKDESPYFKYGFTPANKNIKTSITYMFLHGGWLHIFSNLFLLYLVGPYIEDVWGKTVYLSTYILTGILSAYFYAVHYPNMAVPLIGASGAISGILGAFLIRFWHAKIKFFYWFWFFFGTFKAPAWLMLPLWFANEIMSAKQMDKLYTNGSGVAHWAHVWGFLSGVLIAIILSYFKFEQRVINKKYEEKYTYTNKSYLTYEEASKLKEAGETDKAYALLKEAVKQDIKNTDVVELLWVLAIELNKTDEVKDVFGRHIEYEIRSDRLPAAQFHYSKMLEVYPNFQVNALLGVQLLGYLVETDFINDAKRLSDSIYSRTKNENLPGFLIPFSLLLLKLGREYVPYLVERVMRNSEIPENRKEEIKKKYNEYLEHQKKKPKILNIIRGIPISINKKEMIIKIKNKGTTSLPHNKIKIISVVKIMSNGDKSIFLTDLFLNGRENEKLKIVRLFSVDYDPLKFVPKANNVAEAFKTFVLAVLKFSGAKPYHNMEYLTLKKVKSFSNIEEYDNSLKG